MRFGKPWRATFSSVAVPPRGLTGTAKDPSPVIHELTGCNTLSSASVGFADVVFDGLAPDVPHASPADLDALAPPSMFCGHWHQRRILERRRMGLPRVLLTL